MRVLNSSDSVPAKRPKFSAMSNERISRELNIEIPHWEEELVEWLGGESR